MKKFDKFMYAASGLGICNVVGFAISGLYLHAFINVGLVFACWFLAEWQPKG